MNYNNIDSNVYVNPHSLYAKLVYEVMENGILLGKNLTLFDLNFSVDLLMSPNTIIKVPGKNYAWMLFEMYDRLTFKNPGIAYRFRPAWNRKLQREAQCYNGRFCYSYGEFFKAQFPGLFKKLRSKNTKEAIITLWPTDYINTKQERFPCSLTFQFLTVDNRLDMFVHMRTVDIINMFIYDYFHHSMLLKYIASSMGMTVGKIHFKANTYYMQKKRQETGYAYNLVNYLYKTKRYKENEQRNYFITDHFLKAASQIIEEPTLFYDYSTEYINEDSIPLLSFMHASMSEFGYKVKEIEGFAFLNDKIEKIV